MSVMHVHTHIWWVSVFLREEACMSMTVMMMIWVLDGDNGICDLTLNTVGGEEGNVSGFQGVVVGTVR